MPLRSIAAAPTAAKARWATPRVLPLRAGDARDDVQNNNADTLVATS